MSLRVGQPVQHGFQVPVRAKELVLLQGQIVPLLDGKAAKVGVPRRVGNLTGPDPAKAVGHGGSIVLLAGVRFGAQHSGDALGDSLGGQDHHLFILAQGHTLLGRHNDVFIVGQDIDDLSRCALDFLQNVLCGGVHGLSSTY